jgi:hypothetical protein
MKGKYLIEFFREGECGGLEIPSALLVRADKVIEFRWFRQIARTAGILDDVWNMDTRAGGATEADEAGAALEAIQGSLTHAKDGSTLRYLRRGRSKQIGLVADARSARRHREQSQNETSE